MMSGPPAEDFRMPEDRKLVYSTDGGWVGPEPKVKPKSKPHGVAARVPEDGVIRVAREKRRGGTMSIVTGLDERELGDVAKALKKLCGTGGTAKNGVVEIQGDHREKIVTYFEKAGRKVKRAGG